VAAAAVRAALEPQTGPVGHRMPSSVIRRFQYDEPSRSLFIEFQSGRRYRYANVPRQTAQAMRAAFSKGEFFNTQIRGRFDYEVDERNHRD
jgi:transposase InsO family protein